MTRKRWISILVENEIGVLARISGLFSAKSYNLNSLTVGTTEDETVSRMTIGLTSDDSTFDQIKKQLNRSVEVIKVIDFTDTSIHLREIMFIKISSLKESEMAEVFRVAQVFGVKVIDYSSKSVILECEQTENRNNDLIRLLGRNYESRMEIIRGGSVAVDAISITDK